MKYADDAVDIIESLAIIEDSLNQFRINHCTSAESARKINALNARIKGTSNAFQHEFFDEKDQKMNDHSKACQKCIDKENAEASK